MKNLTHHRKIENAISIVLLLSFIFLLENQNLHNQTCQPLYNLISLLLQQCTNYPLCRVQSTIVTSEYLIQLEFSL